MIEGDAEALAWVVQHFSPILEAQALYRLKSLNHRICGPKDLVNDTWVAVLPKLDRIEAREGRFTPPFVKYLSTTLSRIFRDQLQRSIRRQLDHGRGWAEAEAAPPEVAAPIRSSLAEMLRQEKVRAVSEGIASLSDQDREILVLRGIEQRSVATCATLLDITETNVRVRYHRARQRLGEVLEEDYSDLFIPEES